MDAGRFEEAGTLYAELARAFPRNPGLQMSLGLALHSAGKYREAIRQFEVVLRLQPDFPPALLLLGVDHARLGQPSRAIDPLSRALQSEPRNKIALLELADAFLAAGRPQEAATHFRRLAELDPAHPKAWQGLGLSDLALARRAFTKLEETAPESPYWYALLARSKAEQQQYRTAFFLYKKALEAAPGMPGLHAALADIYRHTGHPDWAAVEEEREGHANTERHVAAAGSAEQLYAEARQYQQQALEAFGRLSQLTETAEIHELMADAYRIQGRLKDSAEELQKALKLASRDRRLEKELARTLWLYRDYERALPLLERLLQLEPDSAELNQEFGDALLQMQQADRSVPYLEKSVKKAPLVLPARASLALAYIRSGQPEKALEHLKTALPIDDDGNLHYQLARAYEKMGRMEESRRVMLEFKRISKRAEARKQQSERERQITPP